MLVRISLLPPENERQRNLNVFWPCILDNQTAMQQRSPIIVLLATLMGKNATDDIATVSSLYAPVFNFTNMYAVSHRSDCFLDCSSKVDSQEAALYQT